MKKFFGLALVFVMLTALLVTNTQQIVISAPNLDSASPWAHEGITSAVAKGFVPADLQNNYTNVITRQEFCRMAVKWVEYAVGKNIDILLSEKGLSLNSTAFIDTSDPDILAAFALGITNGTGDNKFTPNGQFNREQAATMIMNTCRAIGIDVNDSPDSGFADIGSAASWAVNGINFVRANGIMQGTGNNNFNPSANYTREQSIITFNNIEIEKILKNNPPVEIETEIDIWVLFNMEIAGEPISKDELNNFFEAGMFYIGFNEDGTVELVNYIVEYDFENDMFSGVTKYGTYTINGDNILILDNEGQTISLIRENDIIIWRTDNFIMCFSH